jgi:Right handed beta helix region
MYRAGSIRRFLPVLVAITALPLAASATSSLWNGKTLLVAVNAVDSPTCGALATPCRSIGQALANAVPGDTILVRPGRYGDLDADGVLSSSGEETAGTDFGAVEIRKRVRLLSTDGASATVIDANGAKQAAVVIFASGVQFGERGAGFTLTGGWFQGLVSAAGTNVVIAGNTVRNIGAQPDVGGQAMTVNIFGVIEVRDNLFVDNPSASLVLTPQNATAYASVHDNVFTGSNAAEGSVGILVGGANPHLIYRNVVSDNTIGLIVNYGAARIFNNLITGNRDGVQVGGVPDPVPPHGPTFTRNTFSANGNYGLYVIVGTPGAITVRENNFFGNSSGCGIASQSADALNARNNFWGAATGPSSADPADSACGFNGPILTTPFATREFDIH